MFAELIKVDPVGNAHFWINKQEIRAIYSDYLNVYVYYRGLEQNTSILCRDTAHVTEILTKLGAV